MTTAAKAKPARSNPIMPAWLLRLREFRGMIVPIAFIGLLVVLLVPLPPFVMDILICLNISLAVIVLLTTIYMDHPLDFSVFPSLLLALTLFRLVINVACTRLILTANASTPEEAMGVAGHVISAFASFVAGDSLVVGIIIFFILLVVQFVVITKGAGRISEVAARFTLDAMPGKQMAIDADLNAGSIDEAEAKRRRARVQQEADFFGAMDGASKFVRGDAVAGLLITVINVVGGFAIGALVKGWEPGQTAKVFTMLSIGDGLTSQIPSFVIAIAAALIVTRSGSKDQLGNELATQLVSQPLGLFITAGFLVMLSFTPLPTIPLLGIAAILAGTAYSIRRGVSRKKDVAAAEDEAKSQTKPEPPAPESLLKLDTMELEVGFGLVALVDTAQGGDLLERISAIRRQLAVETGFILPPVRIRDNPQAQVNEYRIKIKGCVVGHGQVVPGKLMAMDSGITTGRIEGVPTKEPAFGLDAWWIEPAARHRAEGLNYTVVDPSSVLATHLTEVVRQHADELLTREEVNNLVAQLKEKCPRLVEEVVPAITKPGELQRVLQKPAARAGADPRSRDDPRDAVGVGAAHQGPGCAHGVRPQRVAADDLPPVHVADGVRRAAARVRDAGPDVGGPGELVHRSLGERHDGEHAGRGGVADCGPGAASAGAGDGGRAPAGGAGVAAGPGGGASVAGAASPGGGGAGV